LESTRAVRLMERENKFPGKPPIYIVAMTADVTAATKAACMEAGMSRFMTKPIGMPQLTQLVNEVKKMLCTNTASETEGHE